MDKLYYKKQPRAAKGTGRKACVESIRVPDYIKAQMDEWKCAYELTQGTKITYEQMLSWWMDNIGYTDGCWDKEERKIVMENHAHSKHFKSAGELVSFLNAKGRFWEYCNEATEDIPDSQIIQKSLLYLEFEDLPQIFDIFGYDNCKKVFEEKIKTQGKYYNKISFLLESFYF